MQVGNRQAAADRAVGDVLLVAGRVVKMMAVDRRDRIANLDLVLEARILLYRQDVNAQVLLMVFLVGRLKGHRDRFIDRALHVEVLHFIVGPTRLAARDRRG